MSRDRTYRAVIRGLRIVFAALGLRIDLRGAEHLPTQGGAVVAANHVGYLDFALIGFVGVERNRYVRFLAKSGIFESRISGWAMRAMGHVPVDRVQGAGALRQATRLAAAGEVVGVFSEGTISCSWLVKPLAPGAAAMGIAAGVPIIPMVTFGGHRLITVGRLGAIRRRTPVSIRVGAPLHPAPGEDAHALTLRLRDRLAELVEEAIEGYPRTGHDGAWWLPRTWGGSAPGPAEAAQLDADGLARLAARRRRKGLS